MKEQNATGRGWWRRRRWLLAGYLALLLASHVVQIASPNVWIPVAEERGQKFVDVPETTALGPVAGELMHLAYLEWLPEPAAEDPSHQAVLLLHGSPGQSFDFDRLGPELAAAGYRVLAVDLPGFGNSKGLVGSYSNRAHAHAMLAMLDALKFRRIHVVGWSYGGGVGLNMADIAPDRLASLTLLAATGIQETEGSGSFFFEHAKYAVGYGALVVVPEFIPHFGLIGERKQRHAFVRSFLDTDQRPVRGIMERLRVPTMVLHGRDDVLVPFAGAVEHHRLIKTSRLVVLDANHFLPFLQTEETTEHLTEFMGRHNRPGVTPSSEIVDFSAGPTRVDELLEKPAGALRRAPWWTEVALITALSLASWPLVIACTAVLVATMHLDFGVALVGLLIGRAARQRPGASAKGWGRVIGASAGTLLAARLVSPYVVEPLGNIAGWPGMALGVALVAGAVWAFPMVWTWRGRAELLASIARARHHEFWPAWAFYMPLMPYLMWLGARRGGLLSATCVNPGIGKGGGLIGESKSEILSSMSDDAALEHVLIPDGFPAQERARRAIACVEGDATLGGWPVILKPDSGQRGFSVRLARSQADVVRYFDLVHGPVIVQRYHAGPHECGVLWVRGLAARSDPSLVGGIYAVTRKDFAMIEGDGRRTLERLILDHPRYRCQSGVFLARFVDAKSWIPDLGQIVKLGEAGNHCQGTLFRDGADLITPEFERRIDRIAASFIGQNGHGFDFGRFDIRYTSDDALRRAEEFGIVELNGITSEATNLYDPSRGPLWAYGVLFGQWRELYRIGEERRRSGVRPLTASEAIAFARSHFRERTGSSIAD
ncbi:MAG: alpha/beta fold hydrolase [Phycisphaeraceae bacterium]|nr:alpha/beta fold hydrolase [Phycisphaeraceae bacterium]MCW5769593.1 alpha/beta fold hydrolase [Phycisphaeraceae bacterium]